MRGIVLHCRYPDCQKIIIRNANLEIGTSFEVKCAHCGRLNYICANANGIKVIKAGEIIDRIIKSEDSNTLQDQGIGDTIFRDIHK